MNNFKVDKNIEHGWDIKPKEAIELQKSLAPLVKTTGRLDKVEYVAGFDIAFEKQSNLTIGALVVVKYPELEIVEEITHSSPIIYPYVPGLLSFREGPAILDMISRLKTKVDLLMFDGQGRAHPRGLGIASHLGLLLGAVSVGVGKSRLFGRAQDVLPEKKGSMVDMFSPDGEVVGRMVRTKDRVNPVYVSIGHKIDLDSACLRVLDMCGKYRVPEPTRQAHLLADRYKKTLK